MPLTIQEAFAQFDPASQQVVQALAVYGRPVVPEAVSFLLEPYQPDLGLGGFSRLLNRLATTYPHLVLKESARYSLPPDERAYAFASLPPGEPSDRHEAGMPLYTQYALLARAASYYRTQRTPPDTWASIADLQPQLDEFDLRCRGKDYQGAALILAEISFNYLLQWGHYQLVVTLRERLVDQLNDPLLEQSNLGELGSAYAYLGQTDKAIACQEKALAIARANKDHYNESVWLTNLGNRYTNLGQITRAIAYYQKALTLIRARKDRRSEGLNLMALGTCYAHLGRLSHAIDHYKRAQRIARELGDVGIEGYCLSNLGNVYTTLGQPTRAIAAHDQALAIARQIGSRVEEARRLGNLAEALIAGGQYAEAIESLRLGLAIDDETGYMRGKNYKGGSLASAYLFTGDLAAAREAAEMARRYDTPQNNHNVLSLLGLIAYRQGDRDTARAAFREAIAQADSQLEHSRENPDALNARALAWCGLALCENDRAHLVAARESYRAARSINPALGLIHYSLRLFDALAVVDSAGMLRDMRPIVMNDSQAG
jgi:tetratricopeptide (TPR) repeat protein